MSEIRNVPADVLHARVLAALRDAGAAAESAEATTEALLYASRIGVDSHGVRLAPHYAAMLRAGRLNRTPEITIQRTAPATAMLDADNGLAHLACYRAMNEAITLARDAGIGAVGIARSSHCGAAGAYALRAAEVGMIGLVTSNSDANVALHRGAAPFHGTNPIAMAAPVQDQAPWLLDMATSSIPFNRVRLYRSLDRTLPENVAADASGQPTTDPHQAEMLMPLGGADYGFKGAGLAGMVTILSALLTGATADAEMLPMTATDDFTTHRNVGQFCLAIDPARFVGRAAFDDAMKRYLTSLRAMPGNVDARAADAWPSMAPGDREWHLQAARRKTAIPVDPATVAFLGL